jgi:hypothetical protein
MWTHNRVKEILTAIKWVIGGVDTFPIYHIESSMNMADMVTKPKQLYMADINAESLWQKGMQWMSLPSDSLPKTQVKIPTGESERKDFESELFPEVYSREYPEEDRLLFLDAEGRPLSDLCWVPDLTGLDPRKSDKEMAHQPKTSESQHVSVTIPFKLSWLAGG